MSILEYNSAVVTGKFRPFHVGHRALIEQATFLADKVEVILVAHPSDEIDPRIRALAIYESFHNCNVEIHIVDDIFTDDTTEESHVTWARYTEAILGYHPELVVASETYGEGWARAMGSQFFLYDLDRKNYPISGTLCRSNAYESSSMMPPATKRYMLPRIVVLGAESTGTTTLTKALAEHYDTLWVPEVGRLLSEEAVDAGLGNGDDTWDDQRFWLTSRSQDAMEERYAEAADGLLFCDTDSLATAVWYDYYMQKQSSVTGNASWGLLNAGKAQAKKHKLYILTWDDIPFVQDEKSTRTGENLRRWHTNRFVRYLEDLRRDQNVPYIVVQGDHESRLNRAVQYVDKVLAGERISYNEIVEA